MTDSAALLAPLSDSTTLAARARSKAPHGCSASRFERYHLEHVPDEALHNGVKTLVGRHNVTMADLLAHLAEVDARGIYRERACSSLYTYCIYELRFSEDEAQRRAGAARTARQFPALFEMLAEGAIHLTGLLLLAPHLTQDNHTELLARARFRTKREIERLLAEVAPRPDIPSRIEPLGPRPAKVASSWQAYMASLRGPVRELSIGAAPGRVPPAEGDSDNFGDDALESPAPARVEAPTSPAASKPLVPLRYHVEFTASQDYVDQLEEARNLLQHQVPNRDVARIHELAMVVFVEHLRKTRRAASKRPQRVASERPAPARVPEPFEEPAPARVSEAAVPNGSGPERVANDGQGNRVGRSAKRERCVPGAIRRAVWQRDAGLCTFTAANGRRCRERAGLELHHEHAFALGGPTTVENLRLLCRAHNALLAERDFGRAYVERIRNGSSP